MRKDQIEIGGVYAAKVSGKVVWVRIDGESPYGGWQGTNTESNRAIRIKTAARLRYPKPKEKGPLAGLELVYPAAEYNPQL